MYSTYSWEFFKQFFAAEKMFTQQSENVYQVTCGGILKLQEPVATGAVVVWEYHLRLEGKLMMTDRGAATQDQGVQLAVLKLWAFKYCTKYSKHLHF